MVTVTRIYKYRPRSKKKYPLFLSRVRSGFPSPADDYIEKTLDLNEHLIAHPAATFFVRVRGDSMTGAGIFSGDILIVDRSLEPANNRIVVAVIGLYNFGVNHGKIQFAFET